MYRAATLLLIVCLLLAAAVPAAAQGNWPTPRPAEPLNPVGPIPWPVPFIRVLPSPTPYRGRPTPTPAAIQPTGTATPATTPTATYESQTDLHLTMDAYSIRIENAIDRLEATAPALDLVGSDIAAATAAAGIVEYTRPFWGAVRGMSLLNIYGSGGLVSGLLLILTFVIGVLILTNILPIIAAMWNVFMKILGIIVEFLPL